MSLLPALRGELSALATRNFGRNVPIRSYHRTRFLAAAHNFTMPAMSPTMTEGNITSWKVKEGDSFSAGDVLLEIETDKASMDVEAQDDGIVAKIIVADGAKGQQVGSRIAVLADPGDDISSLEIPPDDSAPVSSAKGQPAPQQSASSEPSETEQKPPPQSAKDQTGTKPKPPGQAQKQRYPLYPSVVQLFHENNLDPAEADTIPASGPSGRLLKGDVLAYLGTINASQPSKISKHIDHLSHLDLSNIKIAEPIPNTGAPAASKGQSSAQIDSDARIALSISFQAIREVQKRVYDSLGIDVPITTFITRAIDLSNTDLPLRSQAPTADELFDDIVGVSRVPRTGSDGQFIPQIVAVAPASIGRIATPRKAPDIFDVLTGMTPTPIARSGLVGSAINETTPSSIFALTVPKAEEKRAKVFLERMKTILQVDPGQLIV